MKEKLKKFGTLSLAKELSRNEQKEILGGVGLCNGWKCNDGIMSCTPSHVNQAYCNQVHNGSTLVTCTYSC